MATKTSLLSNIVIKYSLETPCDHNWKLMRKLMHLLLYLGIIGR